MARLLYGNSPADFTITPTGRLTPGAVLTAWTAVTGGTQVTDLTDYLGTASTVVTSDSAGLVRFYGPDGVDDTLWLDSGQGTRLLVRPVNLPTAALDIGTVTTGTAGATLTPDGTDAWILDLVLPSAGANGVNTAAIQDGAVTAAKFATQLGNLLTDNQASGTDTLADTTGFAAHATCTIESTTNYHASGTHCLKATADGTAGMRFGTPGGLSGIAVTPGRLYTARVKAGYVDTAASVEFVLAWFDVDGNYLSQSSETFTLATTSFREMMVVAQAPAAAVKASIYLSRAVTTAASVVHADEWGLWVGAGGYWAMPDGVPITGTGRRVTHPLVDDVLVQTWDANNSRWQVTHYDSGWRDVSALLISSWTAAKIHLRRVDNQVFLRLGAVKGSTTLTAQILSTPAGFRASLSSTISTAVCREDGVSGDMVTIAGAADYPNYYGHFPTGSWSVNHSLSGEMTWVTDDALPTSLPGTLVSAAPYA